MQLVTIGLLALMLDIPPPLFPAELLLNLQLVTVGLLLTLLNIPPPPSAEFSLKVQFVIFGWLS